MNHDVSAVVLSGGGANGAYEVGVLQALFEGASPATEKKPLSPSVLTGTSIGAFNAAVLAPYLPPDPVKGVEELKRIWLDLIPQDYASSNNHVFRFRADPWDFFSLRLLLRSPLLPVRTLAQDSIFFIQNLLSGAARAFDSQGSIAVRLAGMIDFSLLISNEPSIRLVRSVIKPRAIRESPVKLNLAATNWDTGVVRVFENWDMTDDFAERIVLASAATPAMFPPVVIDGDTYVDGGLVMNSPLLPAIRALRTIHDDGSNDEPDTLHLIYLDPNVKSIPVSSLHSTLDTLARMFVVQFAAKMNEDVRRAAMVNRGIARIGTQAERDAFKEVAGVSGLRRMVIHRYHPRDDVGSGILGYLGYSRERIAQLIERGYRDAKDHDCRRSQCVMEDGRICGSVAQDIELDH
jgi:predicted acylesterase/phospholipase RssA